MAEVPTLPPEILVLVSRVLEERGARGTLAALARASRAAYAAASPALFSEVRLGPRAAGLLTALAPADVAGYKGFDAGNVTSPTGPDGDTLWEGDSATLRRLAAWGHVRRVRVPALPRDHESVSFAAVAVAVPLMPRLEAVCLGPVAMDQLRIWTPDGVDADGAIEDGNWVPPLLTGLAAQRPKRLCAAFRLVVGSEARAYAEASSLKSYIARQRIKVLAADWELESATFHNVVHQVLPALHTANVYEFAPCPVPNPFIPGAYRFLWTGPNDRVPRPLQMGSAIADGHLFQGKAPLGRTRWRFCGIGNQCEDPLGRGYRETCAAVYETFQKSTSRCLARQGLDPELVERMLERAEYGEAEQCAACGREAGEYEVMSMDGMNLL
ncbi:hypothetical protein CspeluHIS016_0301310 [Cutaneotrichosporon spelunceum]|uniref:Uncharacterized protein n=1 Tax=Cutaneotrichosporon spelunceum TaxID=1672016 RepID=A0AAD3TSW5_9TREE|nr:hypothetical protein CspeluHIS016_0301310 [Cutaneotrichosporon spelunceum]